MNNQLAPPTLNATIDVFSLRRTLATATRRVPEAARPTRMRGWMTQYSSLCPKMRIHLDYADAPSIELQNINGGAGFVLWSEDSAKRTDGLLLRALEAWHRKQARRIGANAIGVIFHIDLTAVPRTIQPVPLGACAAALSTCRIAGGRDSIRYDGRLHDEIRLATPRNGPRLAPVGWNSIAGTPKWSAMPDSFPLDICPAAEDVLTMAETIVRHDATAHGVLSLQCRWPAFLTEPSAHVTATLLAKARAALDTRRP